MQTAQETVNPKDEARKIWDQLDAEDAGGSLPAADQQLDSGTATEVDPGTTEPAPAEQSADASQGGEVPAAPSSQELFDKIAGLEQMLGQVTQRLRNAEGHIGGLGSQLKQQQQLAAQVTAKGGEAPSAGEIRAAQGSPKAMESLKRDYPEFAEAMEAALNERMDVLRAALPPQEVQQLVTPEQIDILRNEMAVEIRHPGWQDRVRTPEFMGWLQRQPREVQMLAASESPQDAVRLLDLHSDASKSVTSQRTQRLNAAAALPSGRSTPGARAKSVEDMTPEEYWRYLDELDKQR